MSVLEGPWVESKEICVDLMTREGAKVTVSVLRKNVEADADGDVDSRLFDPDYSLEALTGYMVWDGTWALVALMQLDPWLRDRIAAGARVLELGAGTGIVGIVAAVLGAQAIVTDLAPVVADMISPNVGRNRSNGALGTAFSAALDWCKPLPVLLANNVAEAPFASAAVEIVLAADTVWLKTLVEPFAATVASLLGASASTASQSTAVAYLAFQDRAHAGSEVFAHPSELEAALTAHGCCCEPRTVDLSLYSSRLKSPDKTMRCFRVTARRN